MCCILQVDSWKGFIRSALEQNGKEVRCARGTCEGKQEEILNRILGGSGSNRDVYWVCQSYGGSLWVLDTLLFLTVSSQSASGW